MKWVKKGLVFAPSNDSEWLVSHASVPVAESLDDNTLRIYFAGRDQKERSHLLCIDVAADNPRRILASPDRPLLPLGKLGTFDESGIMPSWIVSKGGKRFLYYIGWNRQVTVPYRLAIGLAVADKDRGTFTKYCDGPVSDRAIDEPYFNTAPCVRYEDGSWKMWYVSCTGWTIVNDHPEPHYHIKYAESRDGLAWTKTGRVCIDYDDFAQAIGRPCVFVQKKTYKMLYSYRSIKAYRSDRNSSYRLGYAESTDGISWQRKDHEVGIERSESGWDSEMIEYCHVHEHQGVRYLFYNGNGFGATGFGYAVQKD
jgi:hypothetical protein